MEFAEMNRRAAAREAIPDGLTIAERMIYQSLCLEYGLWQCRRISYEQAVRHKEQLEAELDTLLAQQTRWVYAETVLKLLRRHESPIVQEAVKQAEEVLHEK